MKKKVRRFDVGGDVRERALRFASLADKDSTEESEAQKEMLRGQAGREYGMKGEEPPKSAAPKPKPTPTPKAAPAPKAAPTPGKFTDSDEDARAMRRAAEEDENTARIARARSEEENESSIRQGRMKSMEREQALERVTPELDVSPIGKVAKLAKTAAGAASRGLDSIGAKRTMEAAGQRAAQTRAGRAAENRPTEGIMRRAQETMTARRAAETRERAQRKAQETVGRGAARTRAAQERKQDLLDEMRMGGEGGGFKKGGKVNRASSRADGIAKRGKTRGRVL
jgi:hypothetical protein